MPSRRFAGTSARAEAGAAIIMMMSNSALHMIRRLMRLSRSSLLFEGDLHGLIARDVDFLAKISIAIFRIAPHFDHVAPDRDSLARRRALRFAAVVDRDVRPAPLARLRSNEHLQRHL